MNKHETVYQCHAVQLRLAQPRTRYELQVPPNEIAFSRRRSAATTGVKTLVERTRPGAKPMGFSPGRLVLRRVGSTLWEKWKVLEAQPDGEDQGGGGTQQRAAPAVLRRQGARAPCAAVGCS